MTFATKKEADEHDKMLDVADSLFEFLEEAGLKIEEQQLEEISLVLARNRDKLIPVLRGVKLKSAASSKKPAAKKPAPAKPDPLPPGTENPVKNTKK